jgi:hypothetical protein
MQHCIRKLKKVKDDNFSQGRTLSRLLFSNYQNEWLLWVCDWKKMHFML